MIGRDPDCEHDREQLIELWNYVNKIRRAVYTWLIVLVVWFTIVSIVVVVALT